ncbi:hypothetical protein C0Q70_18429 [Pomacea canaliculata]|uniref:Uncharacterized protein n=1 Tax=Pomacea canaliculata TaxID=400727 RepID=A0A2T7NN57_POMCA|nr:hypothetical protein C0Q70_18429 [Pomacea canaliculata]
MDQRRDMEEDRREKVSQTKNNSTRSKRQKDQHRQRHTKLNKEVQSITKTDKRDYKKKLANETEKKQQEKKDLNTLYKTNKQLNNRFKNSDMQVKSINGNVIEGEAGRLQRWMEHFESVLNRPDPPQLADIQPASQQL